MYTIIKEMHILGKYVIVFLDRDISEHDYSSVVVDGITYRPVPSYDMDGIVLESNHSFVGKKLKVA